MPPPRLLIIITAFNALDWYRRNLGSLFSQTWQRWRAVYVDDCSTDGTAEHVERLLRDCGQTQRVELIRPPRRLRPALARRLAYRAADPDEVVCMLDGDDWLANDQALARVAAAYAERRIECTYGRYVRWSGGDELSHPVPDHDFEPSVVAARAYRRHRWISSHLRTARARHFQSIPRADLRDHEGGWLKCCTDIAEMWWALEQSNGRHSELGETVYVYNKLNSMRYVTSYYRADSEVRMKRYRQRVRAMLERKGPRLSVCLSVLPEERHRVAAALDHLTCQLASLHEQAEIVVLAFEEQVDAAARELAGVLRRTRGGVALRAFVAPEEALASPDRRSRAGAAARITADLGAGRRLLPLRVDDRPDAASLHTFTADAPSDESRCFEHALERASGSAGVAALDRRRFHDEVTYEGPGSGPFEGGRWVRPVEFESEARSTRDAWSAQ